MTGISREFDNKQPTLKSVLVVFAMFAVIVLSMFAGSQLYAAKTVQEIHDKTGFVLKGTHLSTNCSNCHVKGVFKGTPKTCNGCHTNGSRINSTRKPSNHIVSTDRCGDCHTQSAWKPSRINHREVQGSCATCHNGTIAPGKSSGHPKTTLDCNVSHGTNSFLPAKTNHRLVTGSCVSCHNGVIATGKIANHVKSDNSCENCHSTNAWKPATFNHVGIASGTCSSCHGVTAKGKTLDHVPTPAECDSCHNRTTFTGAKVNHSGFSANCKSCHGSNNVKAPKVPNGHVTILPTQECDACHSVTAWKPARVDHTGFSANCISCHGVGKTGANTKQSPNHITDARECDVCHTKTKFTPATMNHTGVSTSCVTCHNGTNATKYSNKHIQILTPNKCEACHTPFASFSPASKVDHNQVSGSCATCHGAGGTAQTKKPTTHIAIKTPEQCDACHAYPKWKPATNVNHNEIVGSCSTCHNGTGILAKTAKSTNHMPTSNTCVNCHNTAPSKWTPAKTPMNHNDTVVRTALCIDCHTTTWATNKPNNHVPTVPANQACNDCHLTKAWTPATYDHQNVGNRRCDSCHQTNGSGTAPGNKHFIFAGLTSPGTGPDCNVCHTTTTLWLPAIYTTHTVAKFHTHKGNVACIDCHVNKNAKISWLNPDPRTAIQCGGCHTTRYENNLGKHKNAPVTRNPDCASSTCHDANGNIFQNKQEHSLRGF